MCLQSMRGQRRRGSDCAHARSYQGLRCPLPEPLATIKCINGEKRPRRDLAHAQDNANQNILRTLEGIFRLVRSIQQIGETALTRTRQRGCMTKCIKKIGGLCHFHRYWHFCDKNDILSDIFMCVCVFFVFFFFTMLAEQFCISYNV